MKTNISINSVQQNWANCGCSYSHPCAFLFAFPFLACKCCQDLAAIVKEWAPTWRPGQREWDIQTLARMYKQILWEWDNLDGQFFYPGVAAPTWDIFAFPVSLSQSLPVPICRALRFPSVSTPEHPILIPHPVNHQLLLPEGWAERSGISVEHCQASDQKCIWQCLTGCVFSPQLLFPITSKRRKSFQLNGMLACPSSYCFTPGSTFLPHKLKPLWHNHSTALTPLHLLLHLSWCTGAALVCPHPTTPDQSIQLPTWQLL